MSTDITEGSPLAIALNNAIKPKLVEIGWTTGGGDDDALAEYIVLMLTNQKDQGQIAAELSGDLLNLGPDDPGAREFAQWLFEQVALLRNQIAGGDGAGANVGNQQTSSNEMQMDAEMGDAASEVAIPTGPKSMRANGRDKRLFGQLTKQMDRSKDSVLHRVRAQGGNERINSHSRNTPTGPRNQAGRGMGHRMNRGGMGGMPMMGNNGAMSSLTPQQQMEVLSMFELQAQAMAEQWQQQLQQPQGRGNGFGQRGGHQGKSLFDRVQKPQRGGKTGQASSDRPKPSESTSADVEMGGDSSAASGDAVCKFNLNCTNKDCKFAHQSPATVAGTPIAIDLADVCAFGAACKNRKCTARHPSPAQKKAHQEVQDCKFWPNCTNHNCPFRHMPICRNGADCTTPNCKFTHLKVACKFNPCLNPKCPYKHSEDQKRGNFDDKVWTKEGDQPHISERKFVTDENEGEELIIPGQEPALVDGNQTEIIT